MIPRKRYVGLAIASFMLIIAISGIAFYLGPPTEKLLGNTLAQVYVNPLPASNCSLILEQGKNLVSFYCELGVYHPNTALVDQNNQTLDYYAVFSYDSTDPDDHWISYNPDLPNWTKQELSVIDRKTGYWVIMNSTQTYSKEGVEFSSTDIPIRSGWNLVGYPTSESRNITLALNSIDGSYTIVETLQNGSWKIYTPGTGGTLEYMEPYEAYWINGTTPDTWSVNW